MDRNLLYEIVLDCRLDTFRSLLRKLKLKKYQRDHLIARMRQRVNLLSVNNK
jgi:hypothetical protein